jgi:hypothetical protein
MAIDPRSSPDPARRRFLHRALAAIVAAPLLAPVLARAQAALTPLPTDNAQAKALKYTPDASTVAKDPAWKPGSHCGNCQFFTSATGACQIFPGYAVKPAGWCAAWAKRA